MLTIYFSFVLYRINLEIDYGKKCLFFIGFIEKAISSSNIKKFESVIIYYHRKNLWYISVFDLTTIGSYLLQLHVGNSQ